jgi:FkbM family methyltransferase
MPIKEYCKLLFRAWKYRLKTDRAEINFLLAAIKKNSVVIDCGAHKGGYTYWMRNAVGKQGKVIAFEPQKKGYILLNKLFTDANVVIENIALSDRSGVSTIYIQPQSFDVSFEASLLNKYDDYITEEIQTTTIDSYCQLHGVKPSFIKIDVEGAEHDVISGSMNTLSKAKPVLLVESEARHTGEEALQNLFKQMEERGYKGSFFYKDKKLPVSDFNSSIHQDTTHLNSALYANNFVFQPEQT